MRHIKIVFITTLIFITSTYKMSSLATENCPKLLCKEKESQDCLLLKNKVCEVITESYSDLLNTKIKLVPIEKSKILSNFSKGRLTFISFFNTKKFIPFTKKQGLILGYSENKLFHSSDNKLSDDALKSVLAHELIHTRKWQSMAVARTIHWAAYTTFGGKSVRARYERRTDIDAIKNGIDSKVYYAKGLGEYRLWNYEQTEVSERPYLKQVYYFPEQLIEMENLGRSITDETKRDLFFKKLRKLAPVNLEEIRKIFLLISN